MKPPGWAIAGALLGHVLIGLMWQPVLVALVGSASRATLPQYSTVSMPSAPAQVRLLHPAAPAQNMEVTQSDQRAHALEVTRAQPRGRQSSHLEKNHSVTAVQTSFIATKKEAVSERITTQFGSASTASTATRLPPSLQIHFIVHNQRADMPTPARPARALWQWQLNGSEYSLQLDVEKFFGGPRSLRSVGSVSEEGLAPHRYSERGRGEQAAHLDGEEGSVRFSNNRPEAAFERGMQDRLSVVMQLSGWLAFNALQLPPGSQVRLPAVGLGATSEWLFDVKAADPLELPAHVWDGRGQVRKLSAHRRHEFDLKLDVWLGESTQPSPWLPLAMRMQRPNGDWMLMEVASAADSTVPLDMRPVGRRPPALTGSNKLAAPP